MMEPVDIWYLTGDDPFCCSRGDKVVDRRVIIRHHPGIELYAVQIQQAEETELRIASIQEH